MKANRFYPIVRVMIFLSTGFLLSNIITKEVLIVISLLLAIWIVRWVFSFTFSLLFIVVKWTCIIGVIAILLSTF